MCNFFSGIIQYKHHGVWFDLDLDSHSDIMEKFKVRDNKENPNFVKFEMTPGDGGLFDHRRENWIFRVDNDHSQDRVPDWFDEKRATDQAWECLQKVFQARFLIGVKGARTIDIGRWFVRDSEINMAGTAKADLWGSSQVGEMRESSQVGEMRGSSQVGEMRGSSQVGEMRGSSQVGVMRGSSQVGVMRESSQVGEMRESSQVREMWESSQVGKRHDQALSIRDYKITVADKRYRIEVVEP